MDESTWNIAQLGDSGLKLRIDKTATGIHFYLVGLDGYEYCFGTLAEAEGQFSGRWYLQANSHHAIPYTAPEAVLSKLLFDNEGYLFHGRML